MAAETTEERTYRDPFVQSKTLCIVVVTAWTYDIGAHWGRPGRFRTFCWIVRINRNPLSILANTCNIFFTLFTMQSGRNPIQIIRIVRRLLLPVSAKPWSSSSLIPFALCIILLIYLFSWSLGFTAHLIFLVARCALAIGLTLGISWSVRRLPRWQPDCLG